MKTRDLAYLALLVLTLAACAQSGVAPSTQMNGTNSSVVSGSLLFVTSTRSNELRVLVTKSSDPETTEELVPFIWVDGAMPDCAQAASVRTRRAR